MNRRLLPRLGAALGLLAAAWLAVALLSRPREERRALWPASKAATRLKIGSEVELALKDGSWKVERPTDYPAEAAFIQDVLDRLPKLEASEFLSETPSKYALFEVAPPGALRFSAFAGGAKPELDVWIGKSGDTYDSFYFRHADGTKVFEARGLPRYLLDRRPNDWLSKLVLQVESDKVRTLTIKQPGGSLSFGRKDGKWRLSGAALSDAAVKKALEPLLVALLRLEADAIVSPAELPKNAFKKPALELSLEYADHDGKPQSIRLKLAPKGKDAAAYYLAKDGEERVRFEIAGWKVAPLRKTAKDFRPGA